MSMGRPRFDPRQQQRGIQIRVNHRIRVPEVRVIDANPVPALARYRLGRPEFLRVPTRDGFPMEAMLLRPLDEAISLRRSASVWRAASASLRSRSI